jgi:xanthine dehydrogenase accessory factor
MRELLPIIHSWQAEGVPIARAVVVRTYGSAPLREGATMLRAEDGRIAGSVSGGCVEGATAERLAEAHATGRQRLVRFGVSDEQAWSVGLACGGTIDVLVQPAIPEAALEAARAVARGRDDGTRGGRVVLITLPEGTPGPEVAGSLEGPAAEPEDPLVVHEDGHVEGAGDDRSAAAGTPSVIDPRVLVAAREALARGVSGTRDLDGRQVFIEAFPLPPRLVIVGGTPVAQVLSRLGHQLGYEVIVIDARPAFATRERFPDVERLIVAWPDEAYQEVSLGAADAVVVLSHDPKFDEPAITDALRRGCRYVGAIGSRKTQGARRARLLDAGLSASDVDRLHGPIGLDLGGRATAETALAILAEIVATRFGASARPMREKSPAGDGG